MRLKPALQSCGLSDLSVDGNTDKWKSWRTFSQKLKEEKRKEIFWKRTCTSYCEYCPSARALESVSAGYIFCYCTSAIWIEKEWVQEFRQDQVLCISLHIYYSSWFKLYTGRKRDLHFGSEYRPSLYYISSTKHASTLAH